MKKILVVDDEADLDLLIQQRFRHEIRDGKYAFFFARHGQEALNILQKHPEIKTVLTDINMPQMNGHDLLVHLRQAYPDLRIIVLSAYSDSQTIAQAITNGANEFMAKPLNFNEMQKKIDQV